MSECQSFVVNGILLAFFVVVVDVVVIVICYCMAAGTMAYNRITNECTAQEQTIQLSLLSAYKSLECHCTGCVCMHDVCACIALHFTTFYRQTWQLNNLIGFHSLSNDALFGYACVCTVWFHSHPSQPYHICTVRRFQILIDTIHWAGLKCFQLHPMHRHTVWTWI